MAQTTDALELKVPESTYDTQIGLLDADINQLEQIIAEYQKLKDDATAVFGEDDQNLQKMQHSVQQNIDAVNGQLNMLRENRAMLQKQRDALGNFGQDVANMLDTGLDTAKEAFKAMKTVNDLIT